MGDENPRGGAVGTNQKTRSVAPRERRLKLRARNGTFPDMRGFLSEGQAETLPGMYWDRLQTGTVNRESAHFSPAGASIRRS